MTSALNLAACPDLGQILVEQKRYLTKAKEHLKLVETIFYNARMC